MLKTVAVNASNFVDDVRAFVAEMLPEEYKVDDVNRVRMQVRIERREERSDDALTLHELTPL